jgi:hypothetical protein
VPVVDTAGALPAGAGDGKARAGNLPTHLVIGGKFDGSTSIVLQARRELPHFSLLMNRGNFQADGQQIQPPDALLEGGVWSSRALAPVGPTSHLTPHAWSKGPGERALNAKSLTLSQHWFERRRLVRAPQRADSGEAQDLEENSTCKEASSDEPVRGGTQPELASGLERGWP